MLTPMEISQPQNTINGASPADLSRDGDSGQAMLPEIARNAIAMRREQEQLLSDEAYTKALKANTDKNGVINYQGVSKDLGQGGRFASNNLLGYGQNIATSEQNAMERARLADNYRAEMQKINALRNRGVITSDQADALNGFNLQGLKMSGGYGGGDTQAGEYVDTTLKTQPQEQHMNLGDRIDILNRPFNANPKTPYNIVNTFTTGVTPGERIQATLPKEYTVSTPEGQQTVYAQPTVTRHGQTNVNIGQAIGSQSATTDALTKQIAQEYADSNANLQKAQQQENNYSEAANAILNGHGKANLSILSKVFGGAGLPTGSTGQREAIQKSIATTLQNNLSPTDQARANAALASGLNSQNMDLAQLANFLNRSRNMQQVLLNNFYVNNKNNPQKIEFANQMAAKYGKDAGDIAMLHLLAQEGVKNPLLYKKNIEVMRNYMPTKLSELWNKRDLYQQAIKEGAVVGGYPNSPIFGVKR